MRTEKRNNRTRCSGFTMVELMIAIVIMSILALVVGVLHASGQRFWNRAFCTVHGNVRQGADRIMVAFGTVGRRSNRLNYVVYEVEEDGDFYPAEPEGSGEEIVFGDAVEFRYWDVELDEDDTNELIDNEKTATAYAIFYIENETLKVDYGPYPPGGVPEVNGQIIGSLNDEDVSTVVLAENVVVDEDTKPFSHTVINGVGQGSVRINVNIRNPETEEMTKVMTTTMLRNAWPM